MVGKGKYFCKSTLIDRGWTEQMISNILNGPDDECDNPYYKCAMPMHLYVIEKVQKAEKSKEFKSACKKAHPKNNDKLTERRSMQDANIREYRKQQIIELRKRKKSQAKQEKLEAKRIEKEKRAKEKAKQKEKELKEKMKIREKAKREKERLKAKKKQIKAKR